MSRQQNTRILGVDPGLTRTGWGVIQITRRQLSLVDVGVISTKAAQPFTERLAKIYDGLADVIKKYTPETLSVEDVIYAANVQIALKLGHARGSILLVAAHQHIPVANYSPKEIKQSVTGNGNASKEQVQRMVEAMLKSTHIHTAHDVTDALAAAICHANRF